MKKNIKKKKYIIAIFLILIGVIFVKKHTSKKEYATLNIPKINLSQKIYNKNSKDNNLDKGILVLDETNYLEEDHSKIILAAHSGSHHASYFENLDKLSLNDEISIKRDDKIYYYRIIDKYLEEKDGDIEFRNYDENYIVLTTCDTKDKTKQVVIVGISIGNMQKM